MYTYFRPCGLWPLRTSWLLSPSANMDMKGWAFAPLAKAFQDLRSPAVFPSDCDSGMAAIKFTLLSWRRERLQLSWRSHTAIMQIETVLPLLLRLSLSLSFSHSLIPSPVGLLILMASTLLHFLCKYVNIFDDFPSWKTVSLYHRLFIVTLPQSCN